MNAVSVVVSVGTDHHPFDRLMGWLETWVSQHPEADVFVQRGTSRQPAGMHSVELVPHAELCERMASADAVVVQGGPGGIIDSLRAGVKPIVVPRRHDLGEHVDDHQIAFARHMGDRGEVVLAEDEASFFAQLDGVVHYPRAMRIPAKTTDARRTVGQVAVLVNSVVQASRSKPRFWLGWRGAAASAQIEEEAR